MGGAIASSSSESSVGPSGLPRSPGLSRCRYDSPSRTRGAHGRPWCVCTFHRTAPDRLWVTDITEHPTREGKVYCAVELDVFSRRVVGWSIVGTRRWVCSHPSSSRLDTTPRRPHESSLPTPQNSGQARVSGKPGAVHWYYTVYPWPPTSCTVDPGLGRQDRSPHALRG